MALQLAGDSGWAKMAEGCGTVLILGLLATHCCVGSFVFAIPEKRDDDSLRRLYPLDDFLWTGSGDGPVEAGTSGEVSWRTTTVFYTTTRHLAPPASASLERPDISACPQPTCSTFHPTPTTLQVDVTSATISLQLEPSEPSVMPPQATSIHSQPRATPTLSTPSVLQTASPTPSDRPPDHPYDPGTPEKRYWIVTIVEGELPEDQATNPPRLAAGLARLYARAFKRQQDRHLGVMNASLSSPGRILLSRERRGDEKVLVRLHNVTERLPRRVQLVYSVHVSRTPVLARTAVNDMQLVSDAEVARELGVSVVTKAEPYLKDLEASPRKISASPWLLAAGAISAVALLGLVLCLLLLATSRHKRARRVAGQQAQGAANLAYEPYDPRRDLKRKQEGGSAGSATKILPSDDGEDDGDWGLESEPLDDELPPPTPDVAAAAVSAAVAAARRNAASPTSFLSMPSVRRFPRGGNIPEPLSQVLQQSGMRGHLSVRNLDLYPDESAFEPTQPPGVPTPPAVPSPPLGFSARHGSLDGEDPGVLGPCVYQMERGAGPARRRFQELLDDAFSLFGGRSEDDEEERRTPTPPRPPSPRVDSRVQSAANALCPVTRRVSEPDSPPPPRPKTSEPRRAAMQQPRRRPVEPRVGSAGPRGAWETPGEPATTVRPLSAGPFHRPRPHMAPRPPQRSPRVRSDVILADSQLAAHDPAVPLISAIKSELQKFQPCTSCPTAPQLPGSTQSKQ